MEIERQWLFDINKVPERFCFCHKDMEQSYLSLEPEVRLRKETPNLVFELVFETCMTYWITIKGNGDLSREEINKQITKEEYEARIPAIIDNYNRVQKYKNVWDKLYEDYLKDT